MRRVKLIWIIPVSIIVIALSVGNRQDVSVNLTPLPWSIDIPIYLLAFLMFWLGAIAGGWAAWTARVRRNRRSAGRAARKREKAESSAASPSVPPSRQLGSG
ncbi:MAG: lipopolysaccharide assembly protein LapA domain-containing protein [Alphaproteobacteria bacterium]